MKKLTLMLAALTIFAVHASTPEEILVPIDDIYVPTGFDSNDNSEVIISGYLPNLCHKAPAAKTEIVGNTINIKLTALKYHSSNPMCPEVVVPFLETVKMGLLDKGDYKILVNGKSPFQKTSKISIAESTSSAIDEYVYAGVEYVEKEEGSKTVALKGYNPSDCLVLDEVKFISNKSNTYSVLPIMKQVRDFCPMKMQAFSYDVEVPSTLNKEKVLLHVRGMDGNSVNTLFNTK